MQTVHPYLSVSNAKEAIEFYCKAFGAAEIGPRLTDPEGNVVHAEIQIGGSKVMLADENPEFGNTSPKSLGATTVRLNLEVDDADAVANQATEAGASVLIPVADQFYGYRSGRLADPYGHEWILSQKLEDLSQEGMQQRMNEMFKT